MWRGWLRVPGVALLWLLTAITGNMPLLLKIILMSDRATDSVRKHPGCDCDFLHVYHTVILLRVKKLIYYRSDLFIFDCLHQIV